MPIVLNSFKLLVFMTDLVQKTYVDHPYPERNPEDERKRLKKYDLGYLKMIQNIFWGGKKQINKKFRILDAGCGTGDAVIFLAEQLKETDAEIIALDFSNRALEIVKKRAEIRGLKNIKFIHESILNIPKLKLGKFDYIVCTSVLPHLENPTEGLKILEECLKDDGGMGIQLYGKYGRFPIYIIQELFLRMNKNEQDRDRQLENMNETLSILPPFHWFRYLRKYKELRYDLILNENTRPYSVPDIYDLIESANLKMVRFRDRVLYDPRLYIGGKLTNIKNLTTQEQEALAELLNSRIGKHLFFVTKGGYNVPILEHSNEDLIPGYRDLKPEIKELKDDQVNVIEVKTRFYVKKVKLDKKRSRILDLIDGKRSIREILEVTAKETSTPHEELFEEWKQIYELTKGIDLIVLNLP